MSKDDIFDESESSSDEEDPTVDEDTCSKFEIENAFPVKYRIADESAVSLKKVYVLSLGGDKSFNRIAAGLSNNSVQIFDINTNRGLSRPNNDTLTLKSIGTVCGVRFLDETPNNLLVGSTNGDVSLFDLRTGKKEHTFEDSSETNKKPITSFDINSNGRVICMGTDQIMQNVYLLFFDVRQKTVMGGYWESHQDDVTNVKFHPSNPDLLCTGSTDGLINIFDISASSEEEALTSTINTESSVHKLNWHKNVYEKDVISCITHTNDFKSYDCDEGDLIAKFERIQLTEAIKRKSAADCNLVSCHNMVDGGVFLLAASNYNKGEVLRSVQLQNKKLVPHADFDGNKQIIRESLHDPKVVEATKHLSNSASKMSKSHDKEAILPFTKSNLLVTAGESGIVTLWSPSTSDQPAPKSSSSKLKAKSKISKLHGKNPY